MCVHQKQVSNLLYLQREEKHSAIYSDSTELYKELISYLFYYLFTFIYVLISYQTLGSFLTTIKTTDREATWHHNKPNKHPSTGISLFPSAWVKKKNSCYGNYYLEG